MQQFDPFRRLLAISLAALAGYVDAAGFLAADRYFVSFMSGNTTRLGVDAIVAPAAAWIPLLLIGCFVCGVTGGALLAGRAGSARKPLVLALVALLLMVATGAQLLGRGLTMLALLAGAMGALNNTFQRDGEVTIGLTYMTGALVRLGQNLAARLQRRGGEGWSGWLVLWLGLASGAVLGAVAWTALPGLALPLAALATATLALLARRLPAA